MTKKWWNSLWQPLSSLRALSYFSGVTGEKPVFTVLSFLYRFSFRGKFRFERSDGSMFETPIPPFALDSRKEDTPEPPRTTWKRHTNHLKNCHRLTLKSSLPRDKPAWRGLEYTFLACMFFFISDHVMVTQRTASIKYRPMPGAHALPPMHVEASAYVFIIYENQKANSLENITWSEFGKLKRSIRG